MTSTTNVVEAFTTFFEAAENIKQRFGGAVPTTPPYSDSCPPLHADAKLFLVVSLQRMWGNFCHDLLEHSVLGNGPTLGGTHLQPIPLPEGIPNLRSHLNGTTDCISEEYSESKRPVWHSIRFVIRVSKELQPPNQAILELGLSAAPSLKELNIVRNFVVHGGSKGDYEKLLNKKGAQGKSPAGLLDHPTISGVRLFVEWLDEMVLAARSAAS